MSEDDAGTFSLPPGWIGVDDAEILFVNQLLVQQNEDEFILTFGQMAPPVILGTEEERREQIERMQYVPVRVAARMGLPAKRMRDFVRVMSEQLEQYDRQKDGGE